jgi:hypothetical protein
MLLTTFFCRVNNGNNNTALGMLLTHEKVLSKLGDVVQKIHADSIGNEASFECMPDNLDQIFGATDFEYVPGKQSEPLLGSFLCRRTADCKVSLFNSIDHCYSLIVIINSQPEF